jgi:hypothetical protein
MSRTLWIALGGLVVTLGLSTPAGADHPRGQSAAAEPVIYLDVQASTWRPRGRISFGIEPILRMKLISAGFVVTRDSEEQHDLIVRVVYREERGEPIAVNLYGTHISCRILLDRPQQEGGQSISIHESPSYRELVTAPYVEVVEKLQTNPYFYFFGDIARGWHRDLDTTGALIQALERQLNQELHKPPPTPMDTLVSPAETFPDLEAHFGPAAQLNAVEELARLKDPRAVELLERLMMQAERRTRLRAVYAMEHFDTPTVRPALLRVVNGENDNGVRQAAATVLSRISKP